jgi:protein involved in polysaccharide export with SLBB domain
MTGLQRTMGNRGESGGHRIAPNDAPFAICLALPMQQSYFRRVLASWISFALIAAPLPAAAQSSGSGGAEPASVMGSGLIYLRQPSSSLPDKRSTDRSTPTPSSTASPAAPVQKQLLQMQPPQLQAFEPVDLKPGDDKPYPGQNSRPGEFERHVQRLTNSFDVRRVGAELVLDSENDALDLSPTVPADYVIAPGDEVQVSIWGAVDADLRVTVDRSGRIALPRIGSVSVAGVKYQDLAATIERQARKVFKNFELSASLAQLRGIRVFVSGFADRPGAYSVSSLASVSSVLFRAGGPSAAGSFRNVELRRRGEVVARLDLYDLIVNGRRDADQLVQAGDVIHVGPVGKQVAMLGSVNRPAIVEIKASDTVADVLQAAGGFNSVADRTRMAIERLGDRNARGVRELAWPADQGTALEGGDVVRVFSAISAALPRERQNKRVKVEGEVMRPGDYILPPNSGIADLVKAAGGLTANAFVYGTEFNRESTREIQQANLERVLRDLEVEVTRRGGIAKASASAPEEIAAQQLANERLMQRLRNVKPTGRMVLQLAYDSQSLPDLALEDGDRLYVPSRPSSVGVFGSVSNPGSFQYAADRTLDDYLRLAGSATRQADAESVFVVRANGSAESVRQYAVFFGTRSFFGMGADKFDSLLAQPGDNILVPDEINRPSMTTVLKDWTQIFYQLGIGIASVLAIFRW